MPDTTPAATQTGDLTALLAQIRDRNEQYIRDLRLTEATVSGEPCGDVRRLLAVVDAVLKVHRMSDLGGEHCVNCCFVWPCPTIQAVSAALRGAEFTFTRLTRSDEESGWADTSSSQNRKDMQ